MAAGAPSPEPQEWQKRLSASFCDPQLEQVKGNRVPQETQKLADPSAVLPQLGQLLIRSLY